MHTGTKGSVRIWGSAPALSLQARMRSGLQPSIVREPQVLMHMYKETKLHVGTKGSERIWDYSRSLLWAPVYRNRHRRQWLSLRLSAAPQQSDHAKRG